MLIKQIFIYSARSDERGRKALEREKARRDCAELTERLDALTQEYPQLLNPTDVSFFFLFFVIL